MKLIYLAISVLLALCACSPAQKELLIDSFEGEINKQTVDYGTKEGSSAQVTADTAIKTCGEQSLKLEYDLKPEGYMWVARGYKFLDVKGSAQWLVTPENIVWKKYNAFSIQVYGANTGGIIAMDIKDAQGEIWRFIIDDDFSGWKEITMPFEHFFARKDWQPSGVVVNDVLDFPVMSFQFEPRLPGKGEYRFDCVKLVKTKDAK